MHKRLVTLIGLVAILTAACGDDDAGTSDGTTLAATAVNFSFTPDLWTVAAGEEVTLTLTNAADQRHEWVIMRAPITSEDEFTQEGVLWEMESQAGEIVTDTFTAPEAGTYQVICGLEGHFNSGMVGELIVTG